ncbi:glucosyl-3-phosphoglycerate synthase [Amycolatopsis sp. CA-230715]|uniref:glucosyl-3-phosphoglycerate synthase n=1 Tax=Amycolatopsis sp. CA-230715 TaxID=2745196 RepID=UPI001C02F58A|nr:glucosyl-3-phosphoglycerate synthase [Amycolatopsis sp. CA-230715]QWF84365.1 Glucosyl-3-phosphoglycerate synthase [Amycolatopsis sp. CA-230715]
MAPEVDAWLVRRSSRAADWPAASLVAAKRGRRISVVLPARDEEETVGAIVGAIRRDLMEELPVVDELVVVDSRSTDRTAAVAAGAGASVVAQDAVLPALARLDGKGDALWKRLAATTGDFVVFVDADLRDFTTAYVTGLLGPLLADDEIGYVKGFYHRPLAGAENTDADGGGRVTELVARPLLNLYWPELAGMVQPLAGEYAGRRELLESIPFVAGYGVEIGHLIDLAEAHGIEVLAQVDLGHRKHRHQSTQALGRMSGQIVQTVFERLERHGGLVPVRRRANVLAQFRRAHGAGEHGVERELLLTDLSHRERPPLRDLRTRLRESA